MCVCVCVCVCVANIFLAMWSTSIVNLLRNPVNDIHTIRHNRKLSPQITAVGNQLLTLCVAWQKYFSPSSSIAPFALASTLKITAEREREREIKIMHRYVLSFKVRAKIDGEK